jgi:hypothetical protein
MIRDAFRAVLAVAVMAAAAGVVVELRHRLAVIDLSHRLAVTGHPVAWQASPAAGQPVPAEPGRLRQLGRAALNMADAALNVVR